MQNYLRKKEQKERRERDLREGLQLYKYGIFDVDILFILPAMICHTIFSDSLIDNSSR